MEKKYKEANDRFIEVANLLVARKEIKNKKEFAEKMGVDQSRLTHISNYRLQITIDMMFRLHETFGASIDFVLFNIGTPFPSDNKSNKLDDLTNRVARLEKLALNKTNRTKA